MNDIIVQVNGDKKVSILTDIYQDVDKRSWAEIGGINRIEAWLHQNEYMPRISIEMYSLSFSKKKDIDKSDSFIIWFKDFVDGELNVGSSVLIGIFKDGDFKRFGALSSFYMYFDSAQKQEIVIEQYADLDLGGEESAESLVNSVPGLKDIVKFNYIES